MADGGAADRVAYCLCNVGEPEPRPDVTAGPGGKLTHDDVEILGSPGTHGEPGHSGDETVEKA